MPPAPAAAAAAVTSAVQALAPAASAIPATPAGAAIAGADVRELRGRLARDRGIIGEAEADAAALAVDLDHGDVELLALLEDVVHGVDSLAWLDVRDVEQPVRSLGELDERPEGRGLHHLPLELVSDLGLLRHRLDAGDCSFHQSAAGRIDLNGAVVLDVDVGLELLRQPADRLAALADNRPDLVGVDLDLLDAGSELRELLTRAGDRLLHLAEDEEPALTRLLERVAQDVEGDPGDLDVHLQGGDSIARAGDLEVHVAEVILDAGDVGEHDVVVALLDQPHRHASDGGGDRHAGRHQRHRGSAHGAHRRRAVGLERLRDDPDHVREVLLTRDRRHERPLGERAVADVTTLRPAHEARLPDRVRREVVVVPEGLRLDQAQVVDPHVHAARAQRHVGEDLRLAAREQRRAVDPWGDVHLALDRADLILVPTVGPLLVNRDAATDDVLLQGV